MGIGGMVVCALLYVEMCLSLANHFKGLVFLIENNLEKEDCCHYSVCSMCVL